MPGARNYVKTNQAVAIRDVIEHGAISFPGFCGRDIADGLQQARDVALVDPFDHFKRTRWTLPVDNLSLGKAIESLGQGVVVALSRVVALPRLQM